jgi:hypothetical protein
VGDRLVTVLLTVVVPEAADPGDAAAPVADAAVSSVLDIGPAVGVQGHLPVAGGTVGPIRTGQPAAVLVVGGEGSVLLRHLDGAVQPVPLGALGPGGPGRHASGSRLPRRPLTLQLLEHSFEVPTS